MADAVPPADAAPAAGPPAAADPALANALEDATAAMRGLLLGKEE
jgi:hypothetical protein